MIAVTVSRVNSQSKRHKQGREQSEHGTPGQAKHQANRHIQQGLAEHHIRQAADAAADRAGQRAGDRASQKP